MANVEIQSSPDRLTHPLRKTPTGFKRISWDEALTIAADKLGDIRNTYGPLSLVRCSGAPVSYQARDGFLEFMGCVRIAQPYQHCQHLHGPSDDGF